MTYCVGLRLDRGIIFASDTRTNAGFDNVATFSKMHVWERKGDRVHRHDVRRQPRLHAVGREPAEREDQSGGGGRDPIRLPPRTTLFQAARIVGETVRELRRNEKEIIEDNPHLFNASFILGGQIIGEPPRLFQIYQEGNFIEATKDTAYFQIGEHKYGKPILDRVAKPDMRMGVAAKLLLISFDSTLRSNLSVGMPIDLLIYRRDDARESASSGGSRSATRISERSPPAGRRRSATPSPISTNTARTAKRSSQAGGATSPFKVRASQRKVRADTIGQATAGWINEED